MLFLASFVCYWSDCSSSLKLGRGWTYVKILFMFYGKPERPPLMPGQEWVWDYPRPPRVEAVRARLRVELNGQVVAETGRGLRVLETSHPPTYYFPGDDVAEGALAPATGRSWCEYKGFACYLDVVLEGAEAQRAAWCYENPSQGYEELTGAVARFIRAGIRRIGG